METSCNFLRTLWNIMGTSWNITGTYVIIMDTSWNIIGTSWNRVETSLIMMGRLVESAGRWEDLPMHRELCCMQIWPKQRIIYLLMSNTCTTRDLALLHNIVHVKYFLKTLNIHVQTCQLTHMEIIQWWEVLNYMI